MRPSLDSRILAVKKGGLDGQMFSAVVFRPIKKDNFIIKMVTVDGYLILVGSQGTISEGVYGRVSCLCRLSLTNHLC